MSEPHLYALDHDRLETLVLRVLRIVADQDRRAWADFVKELRFHPYHPLRLGVTGRLSGMREDLSRVEDHELTGRHPPKAWEDAALHHTLRRLAQIISRHHLSGVIPKFQPWFLLEAPLVLPFATPEQKGEFQLLESLLFRPSQPLPRHLAFFWNGDAWHSYIAPDDVRKIAEAEDRAAYLAALAKHYQSLEGGRMVATQVLCLKHFVALASEEGLALFYEENRS